MPADAMKNLRMKARTYFVTWRLSRSQRELQPGERTLVSTVIKHFAGVRYRLFAYVVMNDHVHILASPLEEFSLQVIIHSWKSYSAHELQRKFGRAGRIWQRHYFERTIKDDAALTETARYILQNPMRRWPEIQGYEWVGVEET